MKSEISLPAAWLLGAVLCAVVGWPVLLLPTLYHFAPYAAMGQPSIAFAWIVWPAWLLTAAAWSVFVRRKMLSPRQAEAAVASVIACCAALVSLIMFSLIPNSDTRINRMGSVYLYTMAVAPVPPDPDYDTEEDPAFTTSHAGVPLIRYIQLPYADRNPERPCADVYLGSLGGHWAGAPYTCGTRPGRKAIPAALAQAVKAVPAP